jgi:hypothetical protein
LHRITPGSLLAAGPTRWLTLECDDAYRCGMSVIDRATGVRRAIGAAVPDSIAAQPFNAVGPISPDGSTAALIETDGGGRQTLHLINLDSGSDRPLTVPIADASAPDPMVFSPDGRWLFVAGLDGVLYGVRTATGVGQALDVNLPPVKQLAVYDAQE